MSTLTRILIVEDEGIVGKDVYDTIVRLGYEAVGIARTGEQALELVARLRPGLVLMDIRLGGDLDGIDTADRIMVDHNIPVIYVSGYTDDETLRRAKRTSPYGFLVKPFTDRELHTACEIALSRHMSSRRSRSSAEHLVSTLRSLADGVIATDLVGNITFINPVAESLTGWSNGHALNRPLQEVFNIQEQDGAKADPLDRQDCQGNLQKTRCILLQSKDGKQILIEDSTTPLRESDGSLSGLVISFREFTDPSPDSTDFIPVAELANPGEWPEGRASTESGKTTATETEEELPAQSGDASQTVLTGLIDSIADPLFAADESWNITYANNQATAFFNTNRESLFGKSLWSFLPEHLEPELLPEFQAALISRGQRAFEFEHNDERGERTLEANAYPFARGILVLLKDITEKKHAEEAKKRIDQLEGLGLLARGFAHDFNNLLTVLRGNLTAVSESLIPGSNGEHQVAAANSATQRAQDLVQQLFTFAKGGAPIREALTTLDIVEPFLNHVVLPPGITVSTQIDEDLPRIAVDPGQISRVLSNLFQNASQAMHQDGGVIHLRARRFSPRNHFAIDLPPGIDLAVDYVEITVADTGHGIPLADQDKVFAPFYTTRQKANATGIGLTVCESIMRSHGGGISLQSHEGTGTTVTLLLPTAASATKAREPELTAKSNEAGMLSETAHTAGASVTTSNPSEPADAMSDSSPPRILILEDEPLIRQLIISNLTTEGYQVDDTKEGTETIDRFRKAKIEGKPYHLLLMDLSIPNGMGGAQAMQQIRQIDPNVPSIVSSGYSDDPVMSQHSQYGFTAILPKPWDPADLKSLVARILAPLES